MIATSSPRESDVQSAIVDYARAVLPSSAILFCVPNAAPRGKSGRASNGIAGLLPGVSDLVILAERRIIFAEIKRNEKSKVSDAQREFMLRVMALGHHAVVWRSIDDARTTFQALGIATREAAHG